METSKNSYAYVLKDGNQSDNSKPSLVLDESCIKEHDFGMSLMGKVSIEGLPIKPCTPNSFPKIASLWGEFVKWEDLELKSLS
ncbi:hypothetical protein Tco_0139243 [Tanacetum coccineum]